jgi:uncharacterized membrane protein
VKIDPFDLKSALLARHAQHVVLIHFPIALFMVGVGFDAAAQWRKSALLAAAARYNFWIAAIAVLPVLASGLAAWQWQLEGQRLKGTLLLHLIFGIVSAIAIWSVLWFHARGDRRPKPAGGRLRLAVELVAAGIVGFTAHLGGFLSGVNLPG